MPREAVKHGKLYLDYSNSGPDKVIQGSWHLGDPQPEGTSLRETPSLELTWNREVGWVQASIKLEREKWLEIARELEASPNELYKSIYVDVLDRREINHFISTLRRARDAAYGKDE